MARKNFPRAVFGLVGILGLTTWFITFAVAPVTLDEGVSCGTVASPDLTQADGCGDALASRRSKSIAVATIAGFSVLSAVLVDPDRDRRPMDPPSQEDH